MFFVKVNGIELNVKFSYPDVEIKRGKRKGQIVKNTLTVCTVYNRNKELFKGKSRTNESDQFNKVVGRRIALTRAIDDMERKYRTLIWNKYNSMIKQS